ncbi:MAG: DEAD/DEAH box helicase, partial [Bacteroidetes bacterium]|nr:DEAD/DEAH box helicase [Bacteroidota bacterium]
ILTPTRELAIQIQENVMTYSENSQLKSTVIFGGVKQADQVRKIRAGIDILIATPGRLLDLIQQRIINLSGIEILVLDEADRMLDMGFVHDVKKIIALIPKRRQTLFFSATMPESIAGLAREILNNPTKIEVTPESTVAEKIEQQVYLTNRDLKKQLVLHIMQEKNIQQALIFTKTKHGADRLARHLQQNNIPSQAIHGDKAQNKRQQVLSDFKNGKITALVATDIAARGIDIDKLAFVINYEVPNVPETYVHRIGRVGRAGQDGVALTLVEPEELIDLKGIEKLINQKLDQQTKHPYPQTDRVMTNQEKKEANKEKDRLKRIQIEKARASGKTRRR